VVNCRKWTFELVECARTGRQPGAELQDHLSGCSYCNERWEDELRLSTQFRTIRDAATARWRSETQREQIMREFELVHQGAGYPSLKWTLSAAAILLLAIALGAAWRNVWRSTAGTEARIANSPQAPADSLAGNSEASAKAAGLSHRGSSGSPDIEEPPDDNDFVAVPYAPPLATGEFVRVIRTELHPTALARMGIYVDATNASEIPADVVVGEDGFPRAVRLSGDVHF
jgi:hypothetical protein